MLQARRHPLLTLGLCFALGCGLFLLAMSVLEKEGMPRAWTGYFFLFGTTLTYAGIGLFHRSSSLPQFYVAGRKIPATVNGMATAADWISAASFISLVGGLYLQGMDSLAYLIGWSGGYCLLALFIAPYLRKAGQFTVADFLARRYAVRNPKLRLDLIRLFAACATLLICFIYLVAQIYAVGLISARFTGVDFSTGIFLGLASILVCSFLGGMRSVTWTQVIQYFLLLFAFLLPTMYLSYKHSAQPVPPLAYASLFQKLGTAQQQIHSDPAEHQVRKLYTEQAARLQQQIQTLPASWENGRNQLLQQLQGLRAGQASLSAIRDMEQALAHYPQSPQQAKKIWQAQYDATLEKMKPMAGLAGSGSRLNFLAIALCLMLGTAALPHILIRSYTTPSVQESRNAVAWALLFICLLYLCIPALALLLKLDVIQHLVGLEYAHLPPWVQYWGGLEAHKPLLTIKDINQDGIVQFAEISMDSDMLVLAAPEIARLPEVFAGLIAAGALAAALSSADGLLLAMSSSLAHDIYFHLHAPASSEHKRVTLSKLLLLGLAFTGAWVASFRPADILSLVGAAFALAAAVLFPPLVMAIFWRGANRIGVLAGMLSGFIVCLLCVLPGRPISGTLSSTQWLQLSPLGSGLFAVLAAFLALIAGSLLASRLGWIEEAEPEFVDYLRGPDQSQ